MFVEPATAMSEQASSNWITYNSVYGLASQRAVNWHKMVKLSLNGPSVLAASVATVANKQRNGFVVNLACIHSMPVGYQITTNLKGIQAPSEKSSGKLEPGVSALIDYEIVDKDTLLSIVNGKSKLVFTVHAVGQTEEEHNVTEPNVQTITIEVEMSDLGNLTGPNFTQNSIPAATNEEQVVPKEPSADELQKNQGVEQAASQKKKNISKAPDLKSLSKKVKEKLPKEPVIEPPALLSQTNSVGTASFMHDAASRIIKVHPIKAYLSLQDPKKITINILSLTVHTIAYKIQATQFCWKLFTFTNAQGVLHKGDLKEMHVEMNEMAATAPRAEVLGSHCFKVCAMDWPAKLDFDLAIWTVYQKKQGGKEIHEVEFNIEITDDKFTEVHEEEAASKMGVKVAKRTSGNRKTEEAENNDEIKREGKKVKLLNLNTNTVTYKPPYGKDQSVMIAVQNSSPKLIAYQVQANQKGLYKIQPQKGVLSPDETIHLDLQLLKTFTEPDIEDHIFVVTALSDWPKGMHSRIVELDLWKKLELTNDYDKCDVQIIHEDPEALTHQSSDSTATKSKSRSRNKGKKRSSPCCYLTIEPMMITFCPPYANIQRRTLTITNRCSKPVAFKTSCNFPNFYGVSPGKGVVAPGKSSKMEIRLIETFDAAELKKMKPGSHKFIVRCVTLPKNTEKFGDLDPAVWKKSSQSKSKVQDISVQVEHQ